MKTLASSFAKLAVSVLVSSSTVLASDLVLQKVPDSAPQVTTKSNLGPQASFALINYNVRTAAKTLYVSSGSDLKLANEMIDDQAATSYGFSADDKSPVAVIDLGKVSTVRRLSAIYSARATSIDFYVLKSLPAADGETMKLNEETLANLKPVGSAIDDGTQGHAAIDFPAVAGRYVMLRWTPAAHADTAFTVAEVSAFSSSRGNLLASNRDFSSAQATSDSKDVGDSKDVADSKDIPEEAPIGEGPAEGPPPPLTPPPPFTFIPQLVPTSE